MANPSTPQEQKIQQHRRVDYSSYRRRNGLTVKNSHGLSEMICRGFIL